MICRYAVETVQNSFSVRKTHLYYSNLLFLLFLFLIRPPAPKYKKDL
jgi:hypothetical protein